MGTDRFAHDTVLQAEPYHYQALSSIWFGQREPLRTHAAAASLFISEPDLTKEGKVWAAEQCRWSLHSAGVVHVQNLDAIGGRWIDDPPMRSPHLVARIPRL